MVLPLSAMVLVNMIVLVSVVEMHWMQHLAVCDFQHPCFRIEHQLQIVDRDRRIVAQQAQKLLVVRGIFCVGVASRAFSAFIPWRGPCAGVGLQAAALVGFFAARHG